MLLVNAEPWLGEIKTFNGKFQSPAPALPFESNVFSPTWGALIYNSPLPKNIYLLGYDNDPVVKLAKSLFYYRSNINLFDITNHPTRVVTYITPEIVGRIIGVAANFLAGTNSNQQAHGRLLMAFSLADVSAQQTITLYASDPSKKTTTKKSIAQYEKSKKDLADAILNALQQPSPFRGAVIPLFQAFAWRKAKDLADVAAELWGIYAELTHKESLFSPEITMALQSTTDKETFMKILWSLMPPQTYSLQEFLDIEKQFYQPGNVVNNLEWLALAAFGQDFMANFLPPEILQQPGTVYQGTYFTDCGETALLNLFATILFDQQTRTINVNLLDSLDINQQVKAAGNIKNLKDFFTKYNTADKLVGRELHNDWAQLVEGLTDVVYNQGAGAAACDIKSGTQDRAGIKNMEKVLSHLVNGVVSLEQFAQRFQNVGTTMTVSEALSRGHDQVTFTITKPDQTPISLTLHVYDGHFSLPFEKSNKDYTLQLGRFISQSEPNTFKGSFFSRLFGKVLSNNLLNMFSQNIVSAQPQEIARTIIEITRLELNEEIKKSLISKIFSALPQDDGLWSTIIKECYNNILPLPDYLAAVLTTTMSNMQTLNLSGSRFTSFSLGDCPQLQTLTLSLNPQLTSLVIGDCPQLEKLNLSFCSALTSLTVGDCPQLETLWLNNTRLSAENISHIIQRLPQLQKLDASHTRQPTSFSLDNCPRLQILNLSENRQLTSLSLNNCLQLKRLILNNTSLSAENISDIIQRLPQLQRLDLSYNRQLTSLTIGDCPQLQILNLSENRQLTSLTLGNCPQLQTLELSDNPKLTSLTLGNCPQLERVELVYTELSAEDIERLRKQFPRANIE
jgi:hypothetical protein